MLYFIVSLNPSDKRRGEQQSKLHNSREPPEPPIDVRVRDQPPRVWKHPGKNVCPNVPPRTRKRPDSDALHPPVHDRVSLHPRLVYRQGRVSSGLTHSEEGQSLGLFLSEEGQSSGLTLSEGGQSSQNVSSFATE